MGTQLQLEGPIHRDFCFFLAVHHEPPYSHDSKDGHASFPTRSSFNGAVCSNDSHICVDFNTTRSQVRCPYRKCRRTTVQQKSQVKLRVQKQVITF